MSSSLLDRTSPLPRGRSNSPKQAFTAAWASLPTWGVLLALTVTAAGVRMVTARWHVTPRFFPDEYIYSSLAQSLAHGDLAIRGQSAHFPALLEPLITAPVWWIAHGEQAYRLTQLVHVVVMSLSVIPVYAIARRAGLGRNIGLVCGLLTLAAPGMLFSTYIMAEPIAYPLVLAAVAAAVFALDRPSARSQAAFLALFVLSTLARVQFVILLPVFLVAILIVERFNPRRILRSYWLVLATVVLLLSALITSGVGSFLGYYSGVLRLGVDPVRISHWAGVDLMLLAYASGLALVPCAVLGISHSVRRSAPRAQRGFSVMTISLAVALLGQAALYASNGSERFMERYLFYLTPLVAVAFFLGLQRARTNQRLVVGVALFTLILTMRVPITGYTIGTSRQDSPLLSGIFRLERSIGVGNGSLVIALVAAVCCLAAVAAGVRAFRGAAAIAVCLTFASFVALSVSSVLQDATAVRLTRSTYLPSEMTWIDRAGLESVAVASMPGTARVGVQLQLFWNRSIDRVINFQGSEAVDQFGHDDAVITPDGRVMAAGRPVRQPVLLAELGSRASLDQATLIDRERTGSLWLPSDELHMAWLARGLNFDGWWDLSSKMTIWPRPNGPRMGTLKLSFRLPPGYEPMTFRLTGPQLSRTLSISSSKTTVMRIPLKVDKPISFRFAAQNPTQIGDGRLVVAHGGTPRFIPSR